MVHTPAPCWRCHHQCAARHPSRCDRVRVRVRARVRARARARARARVRISGTGLLGVPTLPHPAHARYACTHTHVCGQPPVHHSVRPSARALAFRHSTSLHITPIGSLAHLSMPRAVCRRVFGGCGASVAWLIHLGTCDPDDWHRRRLICRLMACVHVHLRMCICACAYVHVHVHMHICASSSSCGRARLICRLMAHASCASGF